VKGIPYEITITAIYCPPCHNLKNEHFETFFHMLGPKFIAETITTANTLYGAHVQQQKAENYQR